MAKKFEVGTKVRVTTEWNNFYDEEGIVVGHDNEDHVVQFTHDGWSDDQWGEHCWYLDYGDLKKVKEKKSDAKQTYKGNGKHEWEAVTVNTARLRVPGGWLYRYHGGFGGEVNTVVFVPMPEVVKHVI